MDLSTFSYSHIYWIFLLPLIGAGAEAFQMGENSSVLLLDETANIIWFAQTDGAGYKTLTPFTITQYIEQPPVTLQVKNSTATTLNNVNITVDKEQ